MTHAMTEKITREEIQKWSYGCAGKSHGVHINSKVLAALCDLALQALDMQPSNADDLRAAGLTVAVHNDYRLNGEAHTFWLMTDKTGMSYKGEGKTDAEALNQIRALTSLPEPRR